MILPSITPQERDWLARQNAKSIWAVPEEEMPDGVPQLLAVALAHCGYEIYAYQSGGPGGVWCLWLDRLAEIRDGHNGRITVADWVRDYPAILHELGYPEQEAGA